MILIKPERFWWFNVEDFNAYLPKVKKQIPNVPDTVIEQRIYRHYGQFINEFSWININKCKFEIIKLSLREITNDIDSKIMDTLIYRGDELYTDKQRKDTRLAKYMLEKKQAPIPIIITENNNSIQKKYKTNPKYKYFLLEWHMRLAYMKAIHKHEWINLEQTIWLITINE